MENQEMLSELDWNDDEAVVRAAYTGIVCESETTGIIWTSNGHYVADTWEEARIESSRVKAFERRFRTAVPDAEGAD